ncbi:MAG: hypothetical protein ACI4PQ_02605, partial [Butyricicoccaceae bacterium]
MFETFKEFLRWKKSMESSKAELNSLKGKIDQKRQQLSDLQIDLVQKETIISERGNTIERIMREVTEDREQLLQEYAKKEAAAKARLDELEARIAKANAMMDDRERQVYCIASLYNSLRAAAGSYLAEENPESL